MIEPRYSLRRIFPLIFSERELRGAGRFLDNSDNSDPNPRQTWPWGSYTTKLHGIIKNDSVAVDWFGDLWSSLITLGFGAWSANCVPVAMMSTSLSWFPYLSALLGCNYILGLQYLDNPCTANKRGHHLYIWTEAPWPPSISPSTNPLKLNSDGETRLF